jgi:hypothetical protein
MPGRTNIRAELEEQRCLIERQQVEILRQNHQIEMQRRRVAYLEAELDALKVTSRPALESPKRPPSKGNSHRADGRVREAILSTGQM